MQHCVTGPIYEVRNSLQAQRANEEFRKLVDRELLKYPIHKE